MCSGGYCGTCSWELRRTKARAADSGKLELLDEQADGDEASEGVEDDVGGDAADESRLAESTVERKKGSGRTFFS